MTNLDSVLKSRNITLPTKVHRSQDYGLSSSVQMWELDSKEGRVLKNWCLPSVVLEKTLESPLESKETKPVNRKWNQLWILFGRTDAEAPILWPPDEDSWLIGKDPDAGKDWRQKEKRAAEDEICWMASLIQWTCTWANSGRWWGTGKPSVLQSMGITESDMTWQLNNNRSSLLNLRCGFSYSQNYFFWNRAFIQKFSKFV